MLSLVVAKGLGYQFNQHWFGGSLEYWSCVQCILALVVAKSVGHVFSGYW